MSDEEKPTLEDRLKNHPELKERIEALLRIAEDKTNEIDKADEAEQRVIEEIRRLGSDLLHDWARHKEAAKTIAYAKNNKANRHGKKKLTGIRPLGK